MYIYIYIYMYVRVCVCVYRVSPGLILRNSNRER